MKYFRIANYNLDELLSENKVETIFFAADEDVVYISHIEGNIKTCCWEEITRYEFLNKIVTNNEQNTLLEKVDKDLGTVLKKISKMEKEINMLNETQEYFLTETTRLFYNDDLYSAN